MRRPGARYVRTWARCTRGPTAARGGPCQVYPRPAAAEMRDLKHDIGLELPLQRHLLFPRLQRARRALLPLLRRGARVTPLEVWPWRSLKSAVQARIHQGQAARAERAGRAPPGPLPDALEVEPVATGCAVLGAPRSPLPEALEADAAH